jgi:lysophospholipase L1-like esterase
MDRFLHAGSLIAAIGLLAGRPVAWAALSPEGGSPPTLAPPNREAAPADGPVPRTDRNSQTAHEQLLAKAARGGIDIYFEGDSITRRWGTSDEQYRALFANWTQNFHGWNAANFGWGGDTVQNILWRLEHGELDGVHPKIIVLLAGTNNLGGTPSPEGGDAKVEEVVRGLRAIVEVMRKKAPEAVIVLMGITPRDDAGGRSFAAVISRINARISEWANSFSTSMTGWPIRTESRWRE